MGKKYLYLLLIWQLLLSCISENRIENWKGGAIDKPGEYVFKDHDLKIQIEVENSLVHYKVYDMEGSELISTDQEISDIHNWLFFMDTSGTLWLFSSDIGNSFWIRDSTGVYRHEHMDIYFDKSKIPDSIRKVAIDFLR